MTIVIVTFTTTMTIILRSSTKEYQIANGNLALNLLTTTKSLLGLSERDLRDERRIRMCTVCNVQVTSETP